MRKSNRGTDRRALLLGGGVLAALAGLPGVGNAALPKPSAIVRTTHGRVQGLVEGGGVNVFKGVRYGAPPIGAARFKPPQRPQPWTTNEVATVYGPPAIQAAGGLGSNPQNNIVFQLGELAGGTDAKIDNEDCLFLNVWTRGLSDGGKRPIMVWLHGGGFSQGSGGASLYDGGNLARRGDVVVVTVNHRLNVFGYLDLSEIGGPEYADSGNAGMLDLVLALEWVRDNAAAFGGDPGNVTIFGESGGGYKVSTLCAMPAAAGLFHRAIVQSGPGLEAVSPEQARATTAAILGELKITAANFSTLQTLTPDAIVAAMGAAYTRAGRDDGPRGIRLAPRMGVPSLPTHPFSPGAPAQSRDVPLMIGWNKDEMSLFNASAPWYGRLTEAQLLERLQKDYGGKAQAMLEAMKAEFPTYNPSNLANIAGGAQWMFVNSVTQAERKAAQKGAPVYMYNVVWDTPLLGGFLKSPHAVEMPFVFDNVERSEALVGPAGPAQRALADQMAGAWIAFARTGNPNHPGLPTWPPYTARQRATMIFDVTPSVVNDPVGRVRKLLQGA